MDRKKAISFIGLIMLASVIAINVNMSGHAGSTTLQQIFSGVHNASSAQGNYQSGFKASGNVNLANLSAVGYSASPSQFTVLSDPTFSGICENGCTGQISACPTGQTCVRDTTAVCCNSSCSKKGFMAYCEQPTPPSTTTTTTSIATTSASTTAYYPSCNSACYEEETGFSCQPSCITYANVCGSGTVACATPTKLQQQCGDLPASLAQQIEQNEPWYCPINAQISKAWSGELPLALIVVLIAMFIATMIFMVGAAAKNDRLRNFGIGEMYEALASALIVGLFLYVSAVLLGVTPGVFVGAINPFATALHLITTTISSARGVYSSLFHVYFLDSEYTSITLAFSIGGANLPIDVASLAYQIPLDVFFIEPAVVIASFIADGVLALFGEYYLILFFSVAAIPVFLIPGVILRILIPTRSLGGMLIAMAIGFYLVMPTLFAVAYYFTAPSIILSLNAASSQLTRFSSTSISSIQSLGPNSPVVTAVQSVQSAMTSFWLMVLFYPALIIAVTYAFIVQVANFIGGSSMMGSRVRTGFI